MDNLDQDILEAEAEGLTYGKWRLKRWLSNPPQQSSPSNPQKQTKKRKRKFTDEQAFILWQKGFTDEQIGAAVGVSRAYIQRWRDQLELPSTSKTPIDTKKYRLAALQDGTTIVLREGDEF